MTKTIDRTKVVVRRLPPQLKEEAFRAEVDKVATGSYTWLRFTQGKTSTKRVTYSRGYVNFCEAKGAVEFKSKFDGFVFVGARGTQYKCVIEYAPYQRVPKQKGKMDRRQGTIEQDPDYIEFVEKLDKAPVMLPSAQRQYEEEQQLRQATGEGDDEIVMTPLMECIVNKHLNKITSRSSAKERREARAKELKGGKTLKPKILTQDKLTPKVLLKPRPSSGGSDSAEKPLKKSSPAKGKSRRNVKVKEGYQAWVPKVMQTGVSSLDNSKEKPNTASHTSEVRDSAATDKADQSKRGDLEQSSGRGRGRRHRGGRGNASKSSNSKIVWIPKTEKQGGE